MEDSQLSCYSSLKLGNGVIRLLFLISPFVFRVGVEDDSGGLIEDGQEIPYDKEQGNWFISKFSKLDKK